GLGRPAAARRGAGPGPRGIRSRTAPPRSAPDRSRDTRVSCGVLPDVGLAIGGATARSVRAAESSTVRPAFQGAERQAHDAPGLGTATGAARARRADRRPRSGGATGRAVGLARLRRAATR